MSSKEILFGASARNQIAIGVNTLADAVKVTLGARGRTVLLARPWGSPTITKDGVTVAKEIELAGHFANMGAQMVKEVAAKTSEIAGDGTTTATVLAQAMFAEGVKLVSSGVGPMDLKRGIDAAVAVVVADLQRQSQKTTSKSEIAQVATISANGDVAIGELIAEAMERVGRDGVISVEAAQSIETTLDVVEGTQFDRGYLSPYFVTEPEKAEVVLTDAFVLLHQKRISRLQELLPLLEQVAKADAALLIVAEDVDAEALAALVVNKLKGTLKVCAVKAPSFGDRRKDAVEDIAVLVGCQVVSEELGTQLAQLQLKDLGRVKRVVVTRDTTTLVGGTGSKESVQERVKLIRLHLAEASSSFDITKLQERLAKIAGGVALLKVGAVTETAMKETKARVEDALHATRAAVEEGIVAGGGVALMRALPALEKLTAPGEQQYGINLVRRAIEAPLRQIAQNGGFDGAVVAGRVREGSGGFGFNVATGVYEDLVAAGVIDPTKVVRVALQNAASVAALMLTTQALIVQRPSAAAPAADGHAGMDGMDY